MSSVASLSGRMVEDSNMGFPGVDLGAPVGVELRSTALVLSASATVKMLGAISSELSPLSLTSSFPRLGLFCGNLGGV